MTDAPIVCHNVLFQNADGTSSYVVVGYALDRAEAQRIAELLEYRFGCSAIVISWIGTDPSL